MEYYCVWHTIQEHIHPLTNDVHTLTYSLWFYELKPVLFIYVKLIHNHSFSTAKRKTSSDSF